MTVETTHSEQEFDGNGSTTTFPFNFPFFNNSEIFVSTFDSQGNETQLTETVDYTIPPGTPRNGGQINYPVSGDPLPTGSTLIVRRVLPITQTASIRNQSRFNASVHETVFDKLIMILQQYINQALNRFGGNNKMLQDIDMNFFTIKNHKSDLQDPTSLINVGESDARYYNVSGDSLEGTMNANSNRIINLPIPSANDEPLRKGDITSDLTGATIQYVDDSIEQTVPENIINDISQAYEFATRQLMIDSPIVFPEGKTLYVKDTLANFKVTSGATPRPLSSPSLTGFGYAKLLYVESINLVQAGADNFGNSDVVPLLDELKALNVKITQSAGTFLVGSTFEIVSGLNIELSNGAEFVRNGAFSFRPPAVDPSIELSATSDWDIGTDVITLSPTSYAEVSVGDMLYIRNRVADNADYILDFVATPNVLDDWVYQIQTPIIKEKLGGNQVLVSQQARLPYLFTSIAKIEVWSEFFTDVKIKADFRNDIGAKVGGEDAWLMLSRMYGLDISGSRFYLNNESGGLTLTFGRMDSIQDTEFHDGIFLDIFIRADCPNSKLIGGKFFNHRTNDASIFIEAFNFNITISGNSFDSAIWDDTTSVISAIQMDAKVNGCTITGNQVIGYPVGVRLELGCLNNTITGNTFQLCEISGMRMVNTRSNIVKGNTFLDCGLSTGGGVVFSQQQGGIYVNGVVDTIMDGNTFTWVAPVFGNFSAALSGSMNDCSFQMNTVTQSQRAVWLLGNSNNNKICKNTKLEAIGTDYVIVINGASSNYNQINNNLICGNDAANSTGVVIETGSEGNQIKYNEMLDVVFATQLLSTSNYQTIKGNFGDFTRSINTSISAPVMPTNATVLREFEIYAVNFDQLAGNGGKWWQYKQNIGTERWAEFTVAETFVDL